MPDTATLTARLAEAEDALHRLRIGTLEHDVRAGDMSVRYAGTTEASLSAYIRDLKRQLGQLTAGGAVRVGFR